MPIAKRLRIDFIWNTWENMFWPVQVGTGNFLTEFWDADIAEGADKRGIGPGTPNFADEAAEHAKTFKVGTVEPDKTVRIKGWCTVPD